MRGSESFDARFGDSGREADDQGIRRDGLDHHRARSDDAPSPDAKMISDDGADSDVRSVSDLNGARDVGPRSDRAERTDAVIVADQTASVKNHVRVNGGVLRNHHARVDYIATAISWQAIALRARDDWKSPVRSS